MNLRDFFANLWPFKLSADQKVSKLLLQINAALDDLKIRIAESLANESALQKKIEQSGVSNNAATQISQFESSLTGEQQVTVRLKEIYAELGVKKSEIEHVYEQTLARKRKASTYELLASIYKDFGSDLKLNNYLEKFSNEAFKIEYTAESKMRIEKLLNRTNQ